MRPIASRRSRALGLLCTLATPLFGSEATAQISPGPLARVHAEIEGSSSCLACHEPGSGVSAERCLACHQPLRERRTAGLGLHARPEYDDCSRCHIDHQGLDFELVWWGEGGARDFDHRLTGHELRGAHAPLECRSCHRPDLIVERAVLNDTRIDRRRTFLGLGKACQSCHADVHAGRFVEQGCDACHDERQWKPAIDFEHAITGFALAGAHARVTCEGCHRGDIAAIDGRPSLDPSCNSCHVDPHDGQLGGGCERCHTDDAWRSGRRFDHDRARYRLEGAHRQVACERCHDPAAGARRFRPLNFHQCSDCHTDAHRGLLGEDCSSCHAVDAWSEQRQSFDHDRTRYPLLGLHREVACDRCHLPGQPLQIEHFEGCSDCHTDAHAGRARTAALHEGGCQRCHDVDGFRPASFGVADHASTSYPLTGAHERVACDRCHLRDAIRVGEDGKSNFVMQPPAARCDDCHAGAHPQSLAELRRPLTCEACHIVRTWKEPALDHAVVGAPLSGRHATLTCASCHPRTAEDEFRFAGTPAACASCHADQHRGQFAEDGSTECAACHDAVAWSPSHFDHAHAAFPLDGAHAFVPCTGCHPTENDGAGAYVRYRPLPTDCEGCHGFVAEARSPGASQLAGGH